MKLFSEIKNDFNVCAREEAILKFWKEKKIFQKSCEQTQKGTPFIFYEGPPTANGKPGIHHILSRVFKDIYIRFYTQMGYYVPRKAGWDCHGLPVEREVEKKLDIKSKAEIEEKYGIARFNELCKESVLSYINDWNIFSERMAFYVDLENPYFTMDSDYIEVVWGLLKKIWDQGLIYQGYKVVPYDPVLGATMSDAEVDQGYKEVEDLSLYVRFPLTKNSIKNLRGDKITEEENVSIIIWTTTPWTLPSNVALAIAAQEDYVVLKALTSSSENIFYTQNENLICAKKLMHTIFSEDKIQDFEIINVVKGADLIGMDYTPLFTFAKIKDEDKNKKISIVLAGDFVEMNTGSGVVHIAPAYGADDLTLGQKENLPVIHCVGLDGKFFPECKEYSGLFFKEADKLIIKDLKKRCLVLKTEKYKHKYPFGYRTGVPLIYYAKNAWYIRTTKIKDELIKNNNKIHWYPEHIQNGRFGNWLENNRDWALSRERFWGTPLPIWTDGEGTFQMISSRKELSQLTQNDYSKIELHRPHIDKIEFTNTTTKKRMFRVPEVIDCWFDSGAMPYAQWSLKEREENYAEKFFPADFITEAIDQTRGWFYTLLSVSTMISKKSSYKNVICLGHVLDEKGEKMSKSKGNIILPQSVFQTHGADVIRWHFLTGAPPGASRKLSQPGSTSDPLIHIHSTINMLYSSTNFFILYANIDKITINKDWENSPIDKAPSFSKRSDMDQWLLSLLQEVIHNVTISLKEYDCLKAGKQLENFLDALSNWYIRRNRRRFWKEQLDDDKRSAYDTLYRCLVTIARCIAPFIPFASEEVFQSLVTQPLQSLKFDNNDIRHTSVHLSGWPKEDRKNFYNSDVLQEGELIKDLVFLGRSSRMQSAIKVRQPLSRIFIYLENKSLKEIVLKNTTAILDELNVKELSFIEDSNEILDYRIRPNLPRIGRLLGNKIPLFQKYLQEVKGSKLLKELRNSKKVSILLEDKINKNTESILIEEEDLLIERVSKKGTTGVEGKGIVVALETTLTPILIAEGMARDIIRNIQEMRKKSKFEVSDRIYLYFEFSNEQNKKDIEIFLPYIEKETLSEITKSLPEKKTTSFNKTIILEANLSFQEESNKKSIHTSTKEKATQGLDDTISFTIWKKSKLQKDKSKV